MGGRDQNMIANDTELDATQERMAYFQGLPGQFRISATLEEFLAMASGYRAEIERMQKEVLEYLSRHASSSIKAKAI
jgi:hypothetical protein